MLQELEAKSAEKVEIITKETAEAAVVLEKMGIPDYTVVDSQTIEAYACIDRSAEINTEMISNGISIQSIQKKADTLQDFFLKATADNTEDK